MTDSLPLWYLITYDIRHPRRLQRVHRYLKSCAIALQESVFAWQGTPAELQHLKQQLHQRINAAEDDIRGYRLHHPLLIFGRSPFAHDVYYQGYPTHQHCPLEWLSNPPESLW